MALSKQQIRLIKENFKQDYLKSPYAQYINGVGISSLEIMKKHQSDKFILRKGEFLDDLCLSVNLIQKPPKTLPLPSVYHGARIFYKVTGNISAL